MSLFSRLSRMLLLCCVGCVVPITVMAQEGAITQEEFDIIAGDLGKLLGAGIALSVLIMFRSFLPRLRYLLLFAGIGIAIGLASAAYNRPVELPPPPPTSWSSLPPKQWPQIVLTNRAEFIAHTPLRAASSFLIRTRDGRVLGATVRHLLGRRGDVRPEITAGKLDSVLRSWRVYPRTLPSRYFEFSGVAVKGLDRSSLDWLLLKPSEPQRSLPAEALLLRHQPIEVGETVHLLGCPYAWEGCRQGAFSGKVVERKGGLFRFEIKPWVDLRGFSGAPIVDSNGHAVGVMTVWFEPRKVLNKYVEAGGEDVATIAGLAERAP